MQDGTVIQGPIGWCSDERGILDLFVGREEAVAKYGKKALVCCTKPSGESRYGSAPGVLFTKDPPISYIEFLDGEGTTASDVGMTKRSLGRPSTVKKEARPGKTPTEPPPISPKKAQAMSVE